LSIDPDQTIFKIFSTLIRVENVTEPDKMQHYAGTDLAIMMFAKTTFVNTMHKLSGECKNATTAVHFNSIMYHSCTHMTAWVNGSGYIRIQEVTVILQGPGY